MHFPFRQKTDHKAWGTKAGRKTEILLLVGREQLPGSGQRWQTQQGLGQEVAISGSVETFQVHLWNMTPNQFCRISVWASPSFGMP